MVNQACSEFPPTNHPADALGTLVVPFNAFDKGRCLV
jgi:hypothetical protein